MNADVSRIKLVHVTTVPQSLTFLRGQVGYMTTKGFEVAAVSSPGEPLQNFGGRERVEVYGVPMSRAITPLRDLLALWRLWYLLRRLRPHIVHAHTPKGGLLGMIAAWLASVPVRVYHMRGLPLMTASGVKRGLLWLSERVACGLADQVICVSTSLREVAVAEGLCVSDRIQVLLGGSGNGVDALGQFNPDRVGIEARRQCRSVYRIPIDAVVVGFVGRLVRDKGIVELTRAWESLRDVHPEVHLLMVGPFEPQDPVPAHVKDRLLTDDRVHLTGHVEQTAPLYATMDLLVLPTYREGFPNVALEAAAMGLPVVATRIPGCVDAVMDGSTGTLVPPEDSNALFIAIDRYVSDTSLRQRHGQAGRERALREFGQEKLWNALYKEYVYLIDRQHVRIPGGEWEERKGVQEKCDH